MEAKIKIKYNSAPNLPYDVNHIGDWTDCIIPAQRSFEKREWRKAVDFYLQCTSPITTTQQFGWAIPDGIEKDALNLADALLGWCLKAEAKNSLKRQVKKITC